jgi:predicted lipoprotein with Yx(FWY)xxD motif
MDRRHHKVALAPLVGALAVALGACGGSDSAPATSAPPATTTSAAAPEAAPATTTRETASKPAKTTPVKTGPSPYGRILTDGKGHTLYLFTREKTATSQCYGACAKAWPPLIARGKPVARGAAKQSLLGTTRRRDGSRQVTYGGHPVYYYVGETKPAQVLCQNVDEFGGTWLVVSPSGAAIR